MILKIILRKFLFAEKELYDLRKLSEKKGQLLETLESNWRKLEEVQEFAAIQPIDITGI